LSSGTLLHDVRFATTLLQFRDTVREARSSAFVFNCIRGFGETLHSYPQSGLMKVWDILARRTLY